MSGTYCESHASEIPFHVVARMLRAAMEVDELDAETARKQLRDRFPEADPQDLLLDDMLGRTATSASKASTCW
jgi:adenylate cyclase